MTRNASSSDDDYTVVPAIPTDFLEHDEEHLFCDDMSCPCHEDSFSTGLVGQQVSNGLLTPTEADQLYRGRTL